MTELKPCPFCGGEVELIKDSDWSGRIVCGNCNVTMKTAHCIPIWHTFDFLIEDWNTRAERTCRIAGDNEDSYFISCSSCNAMFSFDYIGHDWKYCPMCGAKVVNHVRY